MSGNPVDRYQINVSYGGPQARIGDTDLYRAATEYRGAQLVALAPTSSKAVRRLLRKVRKARSMTE